MPDRFLQPEPLADDDRDASGRRWPAAVPTIWPGLLADCSTPTPRDMSSLRDVIVGGSACPPALMEAFEDGTACA